MKISIRQADYRNQADAKAVVELLDAYACDPMGGGQPLLDSVKNNLISELSKRDFAISFIAWVDDKAVGLLNAFEGLSTFMAKPLINIHDVIILAEYRGLQISQRLLKAVEEFARDRGCCKLTLEVLQGNIKAQRAYSNAGFAGYELDPQMGQALFWQKKL